MGSQQMTNVEAQFDFKMKKVESFISLGTLAIFLLSINSTFWTIVLFTVSALVFIYYFKWYRKKTHYVIIGKNDVIIQPPIFFKPLHIVKKEIKQVKVSDKKIDIIYNNDGADKKISIYSIILDADHWKRLVDMLNRLDQKN